MRALANSFFHRHDRFSPKVYRIFILRFHNIWILTLVDIFEDSLLLFYKVPRNHRFLESEHMGCCGHDRMVVGFTPIYARIVFFFSNSISTVAFWISEINHSKLKNAIHSCTNTHSWPYCVVWLLVIYCNLFMKILSLGITPRDKIFRNCLPFRSTWAHPHF